MTENASTLEPDYENACIVCGQSPVVLVLREGYETYHSTLCGPCMFGTAKALDPEKWSECVC